MYILNDIDNSFDADSGGMTRRINVLRTGADPIGAGANTGTIAIRCSTEIMIPPFCYYHENKYPFNNQSYIIPYLKNGFELSAELGTVGPLGTMNKLVYFAWSQSDAVGVAITAILGTHGVNTFSIANGAAAGVFAVGNYIAVNVQAAGNAKYNTNGCAIITAVQAGHGGGARDLITIEASTDIMRLMAMAQAGDLLYQPHHLEVEVALANTDKKPVLQTRWYIPKAKLNIPAAVRLQSWDVEIYKQFIGEIKSTLGRDVGQLVDVNGAAVSGDNVIALSNYHKFTKGMPDLVLIYVKPEKYQQNANLIAEENLDSNRLTYASIKTLMLTLNSRVGSINTNFTTMQLFDLHKECVSNYTDYPYKFRTWYDK